MRFYVTRTCFDFGGRLFRKGDTVELLEGRHSKYLKPLDVEEVTPGEVAEAAAAAGDSAANAQADVENCEAAVEAVTGASKKRKSRSGGAAQKGSEGR